MSETEVKPIRGRKPALTEEQKREVRELHDKGRTVSSLARYFKVSKSTIAKALRETKG